MAHSFSSASQTTTALYPEPTIVVGIGRFGLAALERLGEDWRWLKTSGKGESSLKNLRLLSLRADPAADSAHWHRPESDLASIALAAGEDDLPTLTLRFAIVRSLGLIRYRDGAYQFALPKDGGVVNIGKELDTRRRRYFHWQTLDSDPRRAVERLHRLSEQIPEVDLFLTPIVERVLHGQSPRILLHLIARCRAYLEGRDPSPWDWLTPFATSNPHSKTHLTIPFDPTWWSDDDLQLLEGLVPPPLHQDSAGTFQPITVPSPFRPESRDLPSPLSPNRLLRVDWQTSGWVAEELEQTEAVEFDLLNFSLFRLGFFDHDPSPGFDLPRMTEAISELGTLLHRGLLRMWLDLQAERHENPAASSAERRRDGAEAAAKQCLEILSELIVRPLLNNAQDPLHERPQERDDAWVDGPKLPNSPSTALINAIVDIESAQSMPERPLLERFAELGLHFGTEALGRRPLFRQLDIHPQDLGGEGRLTQLRSAINDETRQLISFEHLKSYRKRPSRQPPKLTLYLVADFGEPFARQAFRPILRAIHQELIRAYGPIFDTSRDGFDRALSITPIIWTPHPADAFGGDHPDANRIEEASILASIHELRRWSEAMPAGRRCIPQIFINSRVTASSVLSLSDAIGQTRDFLNLQIRNDLGKDPWLRQTAQGFDPDDIFSTFACIQIDFPADRAREYLANRLARQALHRLLESGRKELTHQDNKELLSIAPPSEELLEPSEKRLHQETSQAARRLARSVDDRLLISPQTTTAQLMQAFDENFEDDLYRQVHQTWTNLTRRRGAMDSMVDDLRADIALHLEKTIIDSRNRADRLIEEYAAKGGLQAAQAGFRRLHESSRKLLDDAEADRRQSQLLCRRHSIPDPKPIASARQELIAAAQQKPDRLPMTIGLLLWAIMAPALGAPIIHGIATALGLHNSINPLEIILGPYGWILGAALLFVPLFFLLRHHLNERTLAVKDAVNSLSNAVQGVVEGGEGGLFSSSPSIRSFIAARQRLSAALAGRNFADHIHDRIDQDQSLAFRLIQSLDVQERRLRQRAEALGVRPTTNSEQIAPLDDDIRAIFQNGNGETHQSLLSPEHLLTYYERHFPSERDLDAVIPDLLERAGGFDRWRQEACLSNTEALLDFGRQEFIELLTTPVGAQPTFEEEVGENLARFVARHYSNIGFGARFVGFEGFDTSGIRRLADTSLVLHPKLRRAFEKGRRAPNAPATTETLDIIEALVLPNTAYILSLVQGIHARSIHNLRRHETFFDRLELPDSAAPWRTDAITLTGRGRAPQELPPPHSTTPTEEPS